MGFISDVLAGEKPVDPDKVMARQQAAARQRERQRLMRAEGRAATVTTGALGVPGNAGGVAPRAGGGLA